MSYIGALLPLAGTHWILTHLELMEIVGFVRALGNSYRLAASEPGSSVVYGRFMLDFFRTIVACLVR
jgi:hypothetical protein